MGRKSGYTIRSLTPVLLLSVSTLAYSAVDETYNVPDGANWIAYGAGLGAVGVFVTVSHGTPVGGAAVLVGFWFVLDGATIVRYGSGQTPHEFVSGPESEAMRRMRILHTVHRTLRERDRPHTPAELADACGLPESRVTSALEYLQHRGQVSRTERGTGRYRGPGAG